MLELTIRQASADDADAIADLIAAIEPDTLVSEISRDERRNRFREYLATGRTRSRSDPGAGARSRARRRGGRRTRRGTRRSGVHPSWRRRGVATRLLEHAVAWADTADIHKLTAQVMTHNVGALTLLGQNGFAEEGYLVNQFRRKAGGAADAVLLARVRN